MKNVFITLILLLASIVCFAQTIPVQTDSAKRADFKDKIGLDMTAPDFETKKIDAKVMGSRLADILNYLMENYQQGVYDRRLSQIASEQNDVLENVYFQLKKMKLVNAVRREMKLLLL